MAKRVLPRVQVLVVCDDVEDRWEEVTAYDLSGVRTHILGAAFPYRHPQLCVYLQVTGHARTALCRLAVVRAETDGEIFVTPEQPVPLSGPLEFFHVYFTINDCEFPEQGVFYVQVYFDEVLCGERALILLERETGANGQET